MLNLSALKATRCAEAHIKALRSYCGLSGPIEGLGLRVLIGVLSSPITQGEKKLELYYRDPKRKPKKDLSSSIG